jgi:hypothetical protein
MSSCKNAEKLHNKSIKKGWVDVCKNDTINHTDTLIINGDTIIRTIPCSHKCPECPPQYTDKQLRKLLRHQKDSMDYLLKLEKIRAQKLQDSLSGIKKIKQVDNKIETQKTKQVKSDNNAKKKIEKPFPWTVLLIVLGILFLLIGYFYFVAIGIYCQTFEISQISNQNSF